MGQFFKNVIEFIKDIFEAFQPSFNSSDGFFETTNFSRKLVCCNFNVNNNIHFRLKIGKFVVAEFLKLFDESKQKSTL